MGFLSTLAAQLVEWMISKLGTYLQGWWADHEKQVQEKAQNDAADAKYTAVVADPNATRGDRQSAETNLLNS